MLRNRRRLWGKKGIFGARHYFRATEGCLIAAQAASKRRQIRYAKLDLFVNLLSHNILK